MAIPLRDEVATRRFPWVTVALIVINVIVFLFIQPSAFQRPPARSDTSPQAVQRRDDADRFVYRYGTIACELDAGARRSQDPPECPKKHPSTLPDHKSIYLALLTAMFLHGGIEHIAGNMLFLWVFGNNVEDRLGHVPFLVFYLVGGVVASLGWAWVNLHSGVPSLGASGAIAAVMGAYLVFHPRGRVLAIVPLGVLQIVYLPSAILLGLFFVTQFVTPNNGVAWQAHAFGMGFGFLAALVIGRLPRVRRRAADDAAALALERRGTRAAVPA